MVNGAVLTNFAAGIAGVSVAKATHWLTGKLYFQPNTHVYNDENGRVYFVNETAFPIRVSRVQYCIRHDAAVGNPKEVPINSQDWVVPGAQTYTHTESAALREKIGRKFVEILVTFRLGYLPIWYTVGYLA